VQEAALGNQSHKDHIFRDAIFRGLSFDISSFEWYRFTNRMERKENFILKRKIF